MSRSSDGLDPGSGSVTSSLASNSRAFTFRRDRERRFVRGCPFCLARHSWHDCHLGFGHQLSLISQCLRVFEAGQSNWACRCLGRPSLSGIDGCAFDQDQCARPVGAFRCSTVVWRQNWRSAAVKRLRARICQAMNQSTGEAWRRGPQRSCPSTSEETPARRRTARVLRLGGPLLRIRRRRRGGPMRMQGARGSALDYPGIGRGGMQGPAESRIIRERVRSTP